MSHLYPLAQTARNALLGDCPAVRTRADAERTANGTEILSLKTEWVTAESDETDQMAAKAASGFSQGFVQTYEDGAGNPVYAVTYWHLAGPMSTDEPADAKPAPKAAKPKTSKTKTAAAPAEDHTDDLYFRGSRTKPRRRQKYIDPSQMDLFMEPDARGFEHTDGGAVITDEEGDGTTFGG
ncbi:MAG: hypothetical protein AAF216_04125 [Pseudomonadota bacterium]